MEVYILSVLEQWEMTHVEEAFVLSLVEGPSK